MNVALEIGVLREQLRLFNEGLMATGLNSTALMEGKGAKRALAEAAARARQAELHLSKRRNPALLVVRGMPRAGEGKAVDRIHLARRQRRLRGVHHHELIVRIRLHENLAGNGVVVPVLNGEGACEGQLVGVDLIPRGQLRVVIHMLERVRLVSRSGNEAKVLYAKAARQSVRDLNDGALPHAIGDEIGA